MLFAETIVCFFSRIAAGERNHPQYLRMFDKVGVKVVLFLQCQLEHDQLTSWQFVELFENSCFEQLLCFCIFGTANINLRLESRQDCGRDDLLTESERLNNSFCVADC